jgi:hypothetical protein
MGKLINWEFHNLYCSLNTVSAYLRSRAGFAFVNVREGPEKSIQKFRQNTLKARSYFE